MERAYDEAKYGTFSSRPYMDIVIPSLTDPSVAPPGKHVMSCFVQYAPYDITADGNPSTALWSIVIAFARGWRAPCVIAPSHS